MRATPTLIALLALAGCSSTPGTDASPETGFDAAPGPLDGALPLDGPAAPDGFVPMDAPVTSDAPTAMDAVSSDTQASDAPATDSAARDVPATAMPTLPPDNGNLDYQLGGAYAPPAGVTIVSRDRTDAPARGIYNICYVNGFQIQPGEEAAWMRDHPALILRDAGGQPVIDPDWNEILIDVSTPAKRAEAAGVIGAWIDGCARAGFAAVEIDNLDSYSRSSGLLTEDNAVATVRLFADRAHTAGLAIAQKNAAELVPRRAEMATDFVVAEECNHYHECDAYRAGYGTHVLMIEYVRADFTAGCSAYPGYSIVLRDRNLVPAGRTGYVFDGC